MQRRLFISFLAAASVAACSKEPAFDPNKTIGPTSDLVISHDEIYAEGARGKLDIYAPRTGAGPKPTIVYVYGGAWAYGSKAEFAFIGAALARRGYVVVIPDYRIHPEALWPVFLQDNAAAVAWTKANIARFGGDPSRLALVGHSAGAFNVISLALDERWLNGVGLNKQTDIKAVVGLSGPYWMTPPEPGRETEIFGPQRNYSEPADHIDGKSPPLLLLVGATDRPAGPQNTPRLGQAVRAHGSVAIDKMYPSVSHSDTQYALGGLPVAPHAPIMTDIMSFLADHGMSPTATIKP